MCFEIHLFHFQGGIAQVLRREAPFALECEIFVAVREWLSMNKIADPDIILGLIRLPLCSVEELESVVRVSGLIPEDRVRGAIQQRMDGTFKQLSEDFGFLWKGW